MNVSSPGVGCRVYDVVYQQGHPQSAGPQEPVVHSPGLVRGLQTQSDRQSDRQVDRQTDR